MNKRILMLVPFMGLLLTSCGRQWQEINKDKFLDMKTKIADNIEIPKTGKGSYEGDKATFLFGQTFTDIGPIISFNLEKFYYQTTEFASPEGAVTKTTNYYVPKGDALYQLEMVNGEKRSKKMLSGSIEQAFNDNCIPEIKKNLAREFLFSTPSNIKGVISALDGLISFKQKGVVEYKFYSSGDNSIKFNYKIDKATFSYIPTPGTNGDPIVYNGSEEFVIENGLISYTKSIGNTVSDIIMSLGITEPTSTNANLRYQYNIEVNPEVNPDDWPE